MVKSPENGVKAITRSTLQVECDLLRFYFFSVASGAAAASLSLFTLTVLRTQRV
jgi:hypothetical protein